MESSRARNFPAALAQIRKDLGLSQAKLARLVGVDHSYVSRLEGGTRTPSLEFVLKMAERCELSDGVKDTLLVRAGYIPQTSFAFLNTDVDLMKVYRHLNNPDLTNDTRLYISNLLKTACYFGDMDLHNGELSSNIDSVQKVPL